MAEIDLKFMKMSKEGRKAMTDSEKAQMRFVATGKGVTFIKPKDAKHLIDKSVKSK